MSPQCALAPVFHVEVASARDRTILSVHGELDLATAPKLRAVLAEVQGGHGDDPIPQGVVLDMSGVTFIDGSGLGVLVGAAKRGRRTGDEVVLRHPSPTLLRVLTITRLGGIFAIERQPEAA